ncbi:hypothetical protein SAMD00019534_109210, partial [Acytostelium subglobosum LB1]|uniref:hypothetical protein n=1 Tax=Acytostelium subglobosum LB1 TaxID=1410327 RepID=UPI000644B72B
MSNTTTTTFNMTNLYTSLDQSVQTNVTDQSRQTLPASAPAPASTQTLFIESYQMADILLQLFNNKEFQTIDNLINQCGFSVNAQNQQGLSILHSSVINNNLIYSQYLLLKGANPNLQTMAQVTPLHLAPNLEMAGTLIAAGAHINVVDEEGDSPAHYAIRESRAPVLDLLLKCGANANLTNDDGESLLHLAAALGDEQSCRLLVDAGADLRSMDGSGSTPLLEAKNNGHMPVVLYLNNCAAQQVANHNNNAGSMFPYTHYSDLQAGIPSGAAYSNHFF